MRLLADAAGEALERAEVALAGQQEASPAVVPDRARLLAAVEVLQLGQVVQAEQRLDALAGAGGDIGRQAGVAGEVGQLVQRQEKPRLEDPALLAGAGRRPPE